MSDETPSYTAARLPAVRAPPLATEDVSVAVVAANGEQPADESQHRRRRRRPEGGHEGRSEQHVPADGHRRRRRHHGEGQGEGQGERRRRGEGRPRQESEQAAQVDDPNQHRRRRSAPRLEQKSSSEK